MKQITKTVQKIGNGAHIYLPTKMVGQKVLVTLEKKTIEEIREEILMIMQYARCRTQNELAYLATLE